MIFKRHQVQYDSIADATGLMDNPDQRFASRPVYPDATTRRHNPAIMRGVFVTDPTSMTVGETITPDKWWRPAEQPQIRRRYFPQQQTTGTLDPTALTLQESINLDKWFSPTYQPYRTRRDINRFLGLSVMDPVALIGPSELKATMYFTPTLGCRGIQTLPTLNGMVNAN